LSNFWHLENLWTTAAVSPFLTVEVRFRFYVMAASQALDLVEAEIGYAVPSDRPIIRRSNLVISMIIVFWLQ